MDRFLGIAYHEWPSGVLHPAVSHRNATKQALEMVGLANGDLCRGGSDSRCVLFWSAIGYSWLDPKSAGDRGLLQYLLQSASVHHDFSPDPRSGLSSVYTTAPCHRSGASADQMVRLRCCGKISFGLKPGCSASKRTTLRRSVRPEDAPVSCARPSAGPPNNTRGRMSSYSRCSGQAHRNAICSQSAVGSTRRLSGLLVMLPPHKPRHKPCDA